MIPQQASAMNSVGFCARAQRPQRHAQRRVATGHPTAFWAIVVAGAAVNKVPRILRILRIDCKKG